MSGIMTKKERCFIFDIIFNQDTDFDAKSICKEISANYGIKFSLKWVQSVIDDLVKNGCIDECVEQERCDKTRDLFSEILDAKKPVLIGLICEDFEKNREVNYVTQ